MRQVRILEVAYEEASAAAEWYEEEQQGLGNEFLNAIDAGLDLIENEILPLLAMSKSANATAGIRRLILRRFPFDIVTIESNGEIIVVAIAHHSRRPGYWKDRIDH